MVTQREERQRLSAHPDLLAALEPFAKAAYWMGLSAQPDDYALHPMEDGKPLTVGHFRQAREVVKEAKGE